VATSAWCATIIDVELHDRENVSGELDVKATEINALGAEATRLADRLARAARRDGRLGLPSSDEDAEAERARSCRETSLAGEMVREELAIREPATNLERSAREMRGADPVKVFAGLSGR